MYVLQNPSLGYFGNRHIEEHVQRKVMHSTYAGGHLEGVVYTPVDWMTQVLAVWTDQERLESFLKHSWRADHYKCQGVTFIGELEWFGHIVVVPSYLHAHHDSNS